MRSICSFTNFFFPLFPISYFQVVLSEVNIYVLVQVVFKFCFWAFIESMGSFTGSKGLHFYFFGSFASILSLYTLFEPSLCNYNYTLVLVMFPMVFVTISYLDKFFLPASKLVWCQIILTLLYFFGWNIFLCLTLSHASTFGRVEIMSSSFLSRCFKTFLLFKYFVLLILQFDVEKILVCKVELSLEKMPMYMKFWVYYAFFFFFLL